MIVAAHADDAKVRAEPFDAIELDPSILWADVPALIARAGDEVTRTCVTG